MADRDTLTMKKIKNRAAARRRIEDAANDPDGDFGWQPPSKDTEALEADPQPGEDLATFAARLDRRRKGRP
jgi:hypothetical protein